jgi:hypothetical protein
LQAHPCHRGDLQDVEPGVLESDGAAELGGGREIRFVEDHRGGSTRVPGLHRATLNPARLDRTIDAAYQEHDIDVGCQELLGPVVASPAQCPFARQHVEDGVGRRGDPVAGHELTEPVRHGHQESLLAGRDQSRAAIAANDAPGPRHRIGYLGKQGGPSIAPAECMQV